MKILVVCGAGASSTFVAFRIRRSAADRGLDIEVVPLSEPVLAEQSAGADVLLLGPHLADRMADIERCVAEFGIATVLMTESMVTSAIGDEALDAALTAPSRRDA